MSSPEYSDDDARRVVEASAWRVRLTALDAESSEEFEAWLAADPLNAEAWRRVEAPWDFLGDHAAEPEILAARSAALSSARRLSELNPSRAFPWRTVCASVAAGIAVVGTALYWWLSPADYQTALGERRTLALSDGSRLTLDSNSEVRVAYSRDERDLTLIRGQARFEVVHDASRPFLVGADGATVKATGTDFDVDLLPGRLDVTLIQGHVMVSKALESVSLGSGEKATLVQGQKLVVAAVDIADALAWQSGQLVFHGEPLASAISSLNRYDQLQMELGDPSLGNLRVSGTFNTGDAVRIADVMTRYLKIRAVYSDDGRIIFRK